MHLRVGLTTTRLSYSFEARALSNLYAAASILRETLSFGIHLKRKCDMQNQLIFDLKDTGYPWECLAAGVLVGALMGLAALLAKPRSELRLFYTACASLFVLWMGVVVSTTYPAYSSLVDAESRGDLKIVEGTVRNFHPGGGFSKERFCVNSRCFQYTPETVPVSFTNSPLQGGPVIGNGLRVRIASTGDAIVRLEIVGDRRAALR